jgi:prepilin-type N-terminal cleavage/methylation domain-containing protein
MKATRIIRKFRRGFTLIELMAAMVLFSIIIGLTAWAVGIATDTTSTAEKHMDASAQARAFLDRLGADLNTMITEGGVTALYCGDNSASSGNSAIGFICRARPRANSDTAVNQNFRGAVVGYQVRDTEDLGGTFPLVSRGDGALLYKNSGTNANYRFGEIMKNTADDLAGGSEKMLDWQTLGSGILRFHISFLLNDGTIVQEPPAYKNFGVAINSSCKPIPFRAEDSADTKGAYVVGLIAGVAVLDTKTRDSAFKIDSTFPAKFGRPQSDGETALAVWNKKLRTLGATEISKAVRANIRFYERIYTVR